MFIRSANYIITSSVMGTLAITAVTLRLWAKHLRGLKLEADDYLVLLGLALALGVCICLIIGASVFRFGNHEIFITSGDLEGWPVAWLLLGYGKIYYAIQLLHTMAMPVIKASLLVFLNRLFGRNRSFRIALWITGTYVFLWWLTTFWMSVFQCWPISSNWGTTPAQIGDCIPNYMSWYSCAALLNVISDVAIVLIPVPIVIRLHMPMKKRMTSLAILCTAAIVIAASIGRTVGYFTYDLESFDYSYVTYNFLIWTAIEPCLGVVGCCLPTMSPLFDVGLGTIFSRIRSTFSKPSLLLEKTGSHSDGRGSEERQVWVQHQISVEATESRPSQSTRRGQSLEAHRAAEKGFQMV